MRSRRPVRCGVFLALSLAILSSAFALGANEDPTVPVQRRKAGWLEQHRKIVETIKAQQGNVDLIFIGDSITEAWADAKSEGGWPGSPREMWKKYYGARNAVNLGISGDQTQHVLWRLDHGEIDGIAPKLAVVLIGTNNTNDMRRYQAADIAAGVEKVVGKLRAKLPNTKILVMGIFPRNKEKTAPVRETIAKINAKIAKLDDGKTVFYRDIGEKFLDANGAIVEELMFDYLHLTAKGFQVWAEAIEPDVVKLLGVEARPKRVPVAGRVLIDGKPLAAGFVQLYPAHDRAAIGHIGPDGRFTLATFEPNDGCVLGKHRATVTGRESKGGNALLWLAPKKYSNANISGLEVEIVGPTDNLEIKLTWDGGKPFIENLASGEEGAPQGRQQKK
jgi:lysophospholipase L1-like esterase